MANTKKTQAKDTILKIDEDYKSSTIKGKGATKKINTEPKKKKKK